jgi:hypothetical protein
VVAANLEQCQNEKSWVPAAIGSLARAAALLDMRGPLTIRPGLVTVETLRRPLCSE